METKDIVDELYDRYYVHDSTPEDVISSHWKHYQTQIRVSIADGNVEALVGNAFGDLEQRALINRLLSWMTVGSYWLTISHKSEITRLIKSSIRLTRRMGLPFTYDCFRQVCSLALIARYLPQNCSNDDPEVIIIGDGYGFLSSLVKEIYPNSRILLVDLGKISLFQAYYCNKAHPDKSHYLASNHQESGYRE